MHAVDGVDLEISAGETLGLVGETGCGKSTLARVVMRLLEPTAGTIEFEGQDITQLQGRRAPRTPPRDADHLPGPVRVAEPAQDGRDRSSGAPYRLHKIVPDERDQDRGPELMELVGLNPEHANRYPHEFSGGQRQRIGVARALALRPEADRAATSRCRRSTSRSRPRCSTCSRTCRSEFDLTYLFIAHDLSVVQHISDRVAVMYLGKIVEMAGGQTLYRNPEAPVHGRAAVGGARSPDPDLAAAKQRIMLEGDVPSPIDPPSGCRFHPRCPNAQFPKCSEEEPELRPHHGPGQVAACHFPLEDRAIIEDRRRDRAEPVH